MFSFDSLLLTGIIADSIDTIPVLTQRAAYIFCLRMGMGLWLHPLLFTARIIRIGTHG